MTEPAAWTIRTGKHGERDDWALSNGLVGGGWIEIPDLTSISTWEEMGEVVRNTLGIDQGLVEEGHHLGHEIGSIMSSMRER